MYNIFAMENNKLLQLHRVQSNSFNPQLTRTRNEPRKRVIISSCGKLVFNPNEDQYIYFSKTNKHHVYYIYNKVISIILDELKNSSHSQAYKKLRLPDNIPPYYFYSRIHIDIIKRVKDFFKNYLPPSTVELVTLNYLHAFSEFFLKCSINNKKKSVSHLPEVSDTQNFGGAYGVNSAWLNLLKACTISTKTASLNFDDFFSFILDNSYRGATCRTTIKRLLIKTPEFFDLLNIFTYTELQNPEFKHKNNINNMLAAVKQIEKEKLYSKSSNLDTCDFIKQKKIFKDEIIFYR